MAAGPIVECLNTTPLWRGAFPFLAAAGISQLELLLVRWQRGLGGGCQGKPGLAHQGFEKRHHPWGGRGATSSPFISAPKPRGFC